MFLLQKLNIMKAQFYRVSLIVVICGQALWNAFPSCGVTISKEFLKPELAWMLYKWHPRVLAYFPDFPFFGFLASLVMPGNLLNLVLGSRDFLNATLGSVTCVCPRGFGVKFLDKPLLLSKFFTELVLRKPGMRVWTEGQLVVLWKAKDLVREYCTVKEY